MKNNSIIGFFCTVSALSIGCTSNSLAYESNDSSKWYLGVEAGMSFMSPEPRDSEYQDILKDEDTGFKVLGGYNINPNWAIEAYYTNLGESEVDATKTINNLPTQAARDAYNNWSYAKKGKIGYESAGLTGLWFPGKNNGHLSGGRFNYFVGAGLSYLKNEPLSNEQNKKIKYKKENQLSLMLTGGLEYELSEHFTARLSADSYDKDMNIAMLGLMYGFGSSNEKDVPVQPVVEPEIVEVVSTPVVVEAPEPVVEVEPIVVAKPEPVPVIDYASQVKSAVIAWAESWQAQDVDGYLGSYVPNFTPENKSHTAWKKLRRARLTNPKRIDLNLSDIQVNVLDDRTAVATFTQAYRSNLYRDKVSKQLQMIESNGVWLINSEKVLRKMN